MENIGLKDDPYDVLTRNLLFWNVSGSNMTFRNVATWFILSQHVSQNCNVLIKTPNTTLEYLSFQVSIQKVLFSVLTQEASRVV